MLVPNMTNEELLKEIRKDMSIKYLEIPKLINSLRKDSIKRKVTYKIYKEIKTITIRNNKYFIVCGCDSQFFFNIFTIVGKRIIRVDLNGRLFIFTKHFIERFKERSSLDIHNGILINLTKEFQGKIGVYYDSAFAASINGLLIGDYSKNFTIAITYIEGDFSNTKKEEFLKLKELNSYIS